MKHFPSCFFGFVVRLLSTSHACLIPDLATRPGEKLFWDDFSDASGNWPEASAAI